MSEIKHSLPWYTVLADTASEFNPDAMRALPSPIPTGWPSLDEKLGGGLMPGLYVLGAISSLGKSTFSLQMAENIARRDKRPVLYFSMEMSRRAIAAKSLARRVFTGGGGEELVQSRDLLFRQTEERMRELEDLTREARADMAELSTLRVYTPRDSVRPLTAGCIADAAKAAGRGVVPVVIVDYLQIIPPEPGEREYRDSRLALDRNIQVLRGIDNAVVLVISALNRDAYYEPMGMSAFKESGSIEYSADVLMGLEFSEIHENRPTKKGGLQWLMEQKQRCPRLLDISILKQRYGESNVRVPFRYYQTWDFFQQACDEPFILEPGHIAADVEADVGGTAAPVTQGGVPLKMNNTLLSKELRFWELSGGRLDENMRLSVLPFPGDAEYGDTKTTLSEPGFIPKAGVAPAFTTITYWDMMVADAVFSIYQAHDSLAGRGARRGLYEFRINDVLRVLSGDGHKPNKIHLDGGSGVYAAIRDSIEKMRRIKVQVDFQDEMWRRSRNAMREAVRDGAGNDFLRLWARGEDGPGKVPDIRYSFFDPERAGPLEVRPRLHMAVYEYAMMNRQIMEVPPERLMTPRKANGKAVFSDSVRTLTIKHFTARSVGIALGERPEGERGRFHLNKLHLNTDEGLFPLLGMGKMDGRQETVRRKNETYRQAVEIVRMYRKFLKVLTPRQELPEKWPNSLTLAVRRTKR